jgi:hypothetical protein
MELQRFSWSAEIKATVEGAVSVEYSGVAIKNEGY